jgi:uncharacterized protein
LSERAQRIGFELVVSDRTLYFHARQNEGGSAVTLNREVELLDFSARLSTIGQVEEVFVKGWNARDKAQVIARAGIGDERRMGGTASGPSGVSEAFPGSGLTTVNLPMLSQAEADALARGRFKELALNAMWRDRDCASAVGSSGRAFGGNPGFGTPVQRHLLRDQCRTYAQTRLGLPHGV